MTPAFPDGVLFDSRVLYDSVADRWIFCTLYDIELTQIDAAHRRLGRQAIRRSAGTGTDSQSIRRRAVDADFTRMVADARLDRDHRQHFLARSDAYARRHIRDPQERRVQRTQRRCPCHTAHTRTLSISFPVEGPESAQLYCSMRNRRRPISSLFAMTRERSPPSGIWPRRRTRHRHRGNPIGPQRGSTIKLDCGFTFVSQRGFEKRNHLGRFPGLPRQIPLRASVLWWRIALSIPLRVDTGLIDDPTGATMYAFPSIAVNKFGAALIGYSVFNALHLSLGRLFVHRLIQ